MSKYRKAIVAALALVVAIVPQFAGLEDEALAAVDAVIALLGAFAVYQVPNEPQTLKLEGSAPRAPLV